MWKQWGTSDEYPEHMCLWRTGENYPRIINNYSSLTSLLIQQITVTTGISDSNSDFNLMIVKALVCFPMASYYM